MRSKKAIINIISSLLLQLVTVICGFIVPRMIIESYGSAVNGLLTSVTQFLAYITLLESGFGPVVKSLLYKPIAEKNNTEIERILRSAENFFRYIAKVFIAYMIVLCIIYPIIVNKQFDTMFTISLIIILSVSTFAEYFFGITYKLYLQAEQRTYVTSYIQVATTIINTIMIIILIKLNCNIQIVKLISATIFVFRPIIQNIYVKKKYNLNLEEADFNYKIKQKWDGLAQHIASVIHGNTDVAVLTIFTNVKEVSVYSIYLLVVSGVKNIIQAFTGGIDATWGDMIAKGEKQNLNEKFSNYELFYHTITSIIFICTIILITPFVQVYTKGITDANYIRPTFATLIVLSEFIWAIRQPYNDLVKAAGHFKQTQIGAWVEALSNIVISIILVFEFGIIGVAIGTLVAMTIRTIEFMYHSSKYILERNVFKSFIRLAIIAIETIIVVYLTKFLPQIEMISYMAWLKYAIIVVIINVIIILPINLIVYRQDAKGLIKMSKNLVKKINN